MVCVSRYNIPIVFVDPIPCTMDYWYYEFCVLHLVCAMGREREGYPSVCTRLYKINVPHNIQIWLMELCSDILGLLCYMLAGILCKFFLGEFILIGILQE